MVRLPIETGQEEEGIVRLGPAPRLTHPWYNNVVPGYLRLPQTAPLIRRRTGPVAGIQTDLGGGLRLKGDETMLVRVLIERHIKEGHEAEASDKILDMRKQATTFPGYVSGETLSDSADPRTIIIVSTWHAKEDWEKWDSSPEHKAATKTLEPLLDRPISVRAFVNPWDALLDS